MNRVFKILQKNILTLLIILFIAAMWIYGFILSRHGYTIPGDNDHQTLVALGFYQLTNGVMPWQVTDIEPIDDYEMVATIEPEDETVQEPQVEEAEEGKMSLVYTIGQVDEAYFDDALFIGDSRMEGVYEYAGLDNATFYAKVSMSVYNLFDTRLTSTMDVANVREGLENNQFGKIYIMVGINELGTGNTQYFIEHYQQMIETIRSLQPDAIIILQGVMHVTARKSRSDRYINNANIDERNEAISQLANGVDIFYIDVNPVYDDEDGNLRSDCSADDVHLLGNKYEPWHDFYYSHGVVLGE